MNFSQMISKKCKEHKQLQILSEYIDNEYENMDLCFKTYVHFKDIIGESHEKFNMMYVARKRVLKIKNEFEMTQNMDCPCLVGKDETNIRFYVESMILFTRAAFDYAAGVLSCYILTFKIDSFNEFRKYILKNSSEHS